MKNTIKNSLYKIGLPQTVLSSLRFRNLFLITGSGRSGTKWLATLLNLAANGVTKHEPVKEDFLAHKQAIENENYIRSYVNNFRLRVIFWNNILLKRDRIYGESNSLLRLHVGYLKEVLPNMKLIHLVRDPRKVIRSQLNRGAFAAIHPVYGGLKLPVVDDFTRLWDTKTDLEKACYCWLQDNKRLRLEINNSVRFEDIVNNFEHCKERVLDPLGLKLSKKVWQEQVNKKVNASKTYDKYPEFSKWSNNDQDTLLKICGDEMSKYEYEI